MIDTLLRALDLRTGRFTSPHVERMTERISIDGEPLTDEAVRARLQRRRAVHPPRRRRAGPPAVVLRDRRRDGVRRVRRRPGRRRRRRGRHGRLVGRHQRRRRAGRGGHCRSPSTTRSTSASTPAEIAAGEGRDHQARHASRCSPSSAPRSPRCCCAAPPRSAPPSPARAWSSASSPGCRRSAARSSRCRACAARYDEVFLPLYGAHQAQNAAVALAAVEAFASAATASRSTTSWSARPSRRSPRRAGSRSSGAARRSCSTPPTTRTAPRPWPRRWRTPSRSRPLIGVIGVMADKDAEGLLAALEPAARPRGRAPRTPPPARCRPSELAEAAREVFGEDRVTVAPRLADAIDQAHDAGRGRRRLRRPARRRRRPGHRLGGHRRRGAHDADRAGSAR